ncbi:hypothetical protein MIC97_08895 [Aquamicrobium sp. NLF2-7]|uniref:hypothetical protein n=1 Tax=Aquamicrobium sp. NLF2-7 TaxID=2918753 RepID=UPI001EFB7952|nr:hypothetical protein [Aquamicrobium sp. NLF2-7]MCG8271618.1 hypothetical protein [Aquamicrobium sp. NLF2-7]
MKLTEAQREELFALKETNDLVGPSFLMRHHWHESGYQTLVRRGLVVWGDPPEGFDKRMFAGVEITEAGRAALAEGKDE